VDTAVPKILRAPVYLVIGIYSGSGVSPETIHQMRTWPGSFAILALSVAALIAASYWWLHKRSGWDRSTALLASLPGALAFVIAAAEGLRVDMKKVTLSQSIRVLALVELIPLATFLTGVHQPGSPSASLGSATTVEILVLLFCGGLAGIVMEKLNLPGGWMLGGLVSTAALLLTGQVSAGLPRMVVLPATVALAAIAGSRFRPGDLAILRSIAGPAIVAFAIALGISLLSAATVVYLFGVGFVQALLAFAPGALDALILIAFELDADPAYVAAHHVARFVALVLAVPVLARWLARRDATS
jgi:membrane AbrB-like protein